MDGHLGNNILLKRWSETDLVVIMTINMCWNQIIAEIKDLLQLGKDVVNEMEKLKFMVRCWKAENKCTVMKNTWVNFNGNFIFSRPLRWALYSLCRVPLFRTTIQKYPYVLVVCCSKRFFFGRFVPIFGVFQFMAPVDIHIIEYIISFIHAICFEWLLY